MIDFNEALKKLTDSMGDVKPAPTTPEQDAEKRAKYEAEQADRRAVLRGLRNAMRDECERFNATYRMQPQKPDTQATPPTAHLFAHNTELVVKRESLRLTQIEWGALEVQAGYDMHTVAQHISVIVRRHLRKDVETILKSSEAKRPVGRPPAQKAPMHLEPWTPAIWEDELETWHGQAAERNPTYTRAEVRVAHDLYLETLFAHLQRVGFPHPFKAGFTAI